MLLSQYDKVVCLSVDVRYAKEKERVTSMLLSKGVREADLHFFVDGKGDILPPSSYSQISPTPPPDWTQSPGAFAHFCAMQEVVRRADQEMVANLLWVEDDCVFTPEFDSVVDAATEQLSKLPPWDLLYYGANHTWGHTEQLAPNVLQVQSSYTTHCLGIPRRAFKWILALKPRHVIDYMIAMHIQHSKPCYAVWPNVARQQRGWSLISNMQADYDNYFDNKGVNW